MSKTAADAEAVTSAAETLLGVPMVTRWVLVAEIIDADGSRGLADCTSPGLAYWDVTGMLTSALQTRASQPIWTIDDDTEGDDE